MREATARRRAPSLPRRTVRRRGSRGVSTQRSAGRRMRKAATFQAALRSSTIASRTGIGSAVSACIRRSSGFATAKIAPTHENESAKEAVATLSGRTSATNAAAIAREFQDSAERPKARAVSATVTITAARIAGNCAPLQSAKPHTARMARAHVTRRGGMPSENSASASAATAPRCNPAVTSTCTVPVA